MLKFPQPTAKLNGFLQKLFRVILGSLLFMLLKVGLTSVLLSISRAPEWLAYLIVTVSVSIFGWIYHSKISFQIPLNRGSLWRWISQAIVLKLLDFASFNVIFYLLGVPPVWSIILTSGFVFVIRLLVFWRFVFASKPIPSPGMQ